MTRARKPIRARVTTRLEGSWDVVQEQIEFVEHVFLIEHDIVESSSNRIDRISSSLNRGWFEMVLELLFVYGEHESSSVAQILNVVPNIDPPP